MTFFSPRFRACRSAWPTALSACWGVGLLVMTGGLAACGDSAFAPVARTAIERLTPKTPSSVDPNAVDRIPYATMGAKVGSADQTVIVLATVEGSRLTWVAPDSAVVVTRGKRVVRTSGLGGGRNRDLGEVSVLTPDPLDGPLAAMEGATVRLLIDVPADKAYQVPIACRLQSEGDETLTLLGREQFSVRHVSEHCRALQAVSWSYVNHYWFDLASGQLKKSQQVLNPDWFTLELEVLKPYTGAGAL